MKEIIYIQAGNMSNHVGTHFWNAQQSYFIYGEDKEVVVDNDVSFREGISPRVCHSPYVRFPARGLNPANRESRHIVHGFSNLTERVKLSESSYSYPRLPTLSLANFGSLSSAKGLYAEDEGDDLPPPPWLVKTRSPIAVFGADCQARDGTVDEIHRDPIPDIAYQTQLDQEVDEDPAQRAPDTERSPEVPPLVASDVRYWSDYNRVYYVPRSLHKLPDLADWEAADGDWHGGKDAFLRYDSVSWPFRRSHRSHITDVVGFSCGRTMSLWMIHSGFLWKNATPSRSVRSLAWCSGSSWREH